MLSKTPLFFALGLMLVSAISRAQNGAEVLHSRPQASINLLCQRNVGGGDKVLLAIQKDALAICKGPRFVDFFNAFMFKRYCATSELVPSSKSTSPKDADTAVAQNDPVSLVTVADHAGAIHSGIRLTISVRQTASDIRAHIVLSYPFVSTNIYVSPDAEYTCD